MASLKKVFYFHKVNSNLHLEDYSVNSFSVKADYIFFISKFRLERLHISCSNKDNPLESVTR